MKFNHLTFPLNASVREFMLRGTKLAAVVTPAVNDDDVSFLRIIGIGNVDVVETSDFYWVHPDYRLTK